MSEYHEPVLLHECIDGLNLKEGGVYVDVTFGGGGHSKEILNQLKKGKLIAFDRDAEAIENKVNDNRLTIVNHNYKYMKNFLGQMKQIPVDGILADLGVSSHHFDSGRRGFSIRFDTPLDMRMDQSANKSAKEVINQYSAEDLKMIFWQFGEIKNASKLSNWILNKRSQSEINTTGELVELIKPNISPKKINQYLAQVFQAIRIEVNDELAGLKALLKQSLEVLNSGGRLVVISYHSLEDRLVKNFFRTGNLKGVVQENEYGIIPGPFRLINRKVIVPTVEQVEQNSRARSAKLRIAEKI